MTPARRIHALLARDHDHIDALLERTTLPSGEIDLEAFGEYRRALARHIGAEEKILFPAVLKAGGEVPEKKRLRSDHGKLVAMLVPTPSPALLGEIRSILAPHNALEEAEGGIYDACEQALGDDVDRVLAELAEAPDVPMRVHYDGPLVEVAAARRRRETE